MIEVMPEFFTLYVYFVPKLNILHISPYDHLTRIHLNAKHSLKIYDVFILGEL